MIKVLFLFPNSVTSEEADDIISNLLIPANKQQKGFQSMSTSVGSLMSPDGPVPYERIVEATFESFDDVKSAAESAIQMGDERRKTAGVSIYIFEVGSL